MTTTITSVVWVLFLTMVSMTIVESIAIASSFQTIPLLQYDMTVEHCQRSRVPNQGFLQGDGSSMELLRNTTTTVCAPGFGVQSNFHGNDSTIATAAPKAVYSSKPIGSFADELALDTTPTSGAKNGITLSLWIRPGQLHQSTGPRNIFTLGWDTFDDTALGDKTSLPPTGFTACDQSKLDFQLSAIGPESMEIVYRTSDSIFEPCQRIEFNTTTTRNQPMHLAISLGNYHQEVLVNGKVVGRKREPFDTTLRHWNPNSSLQFITYPTTNDHYRQPTLPWSGQLFRFSIYGGALEKHRVRHIMSMGLPPSQPVAQGKTVHIPEDASLDETSGVLQQVLISYNFLDSELNKLLASLSLPYQPAAAVRMYITRFPSRGHLIQKDDGRRIEPSGDLPVPVSSIGDLVYMPRKDEHSEFPNLSYTSFDYCVTTHKILTYSQCTSATLSVIVDPINDPPVAIQPLVYTVYEGTQKNAEALRLTGSDIDKNDHIQAIQITSPPKLGNLMLSVATFRTHDNLLHGTSLATINYTIPGKEAYVEYEFAAYNQTTIHRDSWVTDHFKFRVQDSFGSWSLEQEATIRVLGSLVPSSEVLEKSMASVVIKRERTGTQWRGIDRSGWNRTLGFFLTETPSNATIYDSNGEALEKNDVIEAKRYLFTGDECHVETDIELSGIPGVCDETNSLMIHYVLKYQVVALDLDKEVTSISSVIEQKISIACKVEPVSLHFVVEDKPAATLFTSVAAADDKCSGYAFDFTEESRQECHHTTLVFGVRVNSTKYPQEPVYVVLDTTSGGLLSLNRNYTSSIHPLFEHPVMSESIHFLVPAENLTDILSAVHYQSDSVGEDEIRVTLQHGLCHHNETFLLRQEFSEPSEVCYKAHRTMRVNVLENPNECELSKYPFPWLPLLVIVVLGPIFYIKDKAKQTAEEIYADWFNTKPPQEEIHREID